MDPLLISRERTAGPDPEQTVGLLRTDVQRINLMGSCGDKRRPRTLRNDRSLNDLIRPQQQRLRDVDAEHLRRFEINHKFDLRWLENRQISRLGAIDDLAGVDPGLAIDF